jgi:hypothetical protein
MEVDYWRPTWYETRFHVNEHSTNAFLCQRTFNKRVPRLPIDYMSSRADKNAFIRKSFVEAVTDS